MLAEFFCAQQDNHDIACRFFDKGLVQYPYAIDLLIDVFLCWFSFCLEHILIFAFCLIRMGIYFYLAGASLGKITDMLFANEVPSPNGQGLPSTNFYPTPNISLWLDLSFI